MKEKVSGVDSHHKAHAGKGKIQTQAQHITPSDSELIDALERYIEKAPLLIWYGRGGEGPGQGCRHAGLSMLCGDRTLREALAGLIETSKAGGAS